MDYSEFEHLWDGDEPYILCHTSGSTGKPKELKLRKEFMLDSARRTNDWFGIDASSWLYSCISPDYIGGKMMYVRARAAGCRFGWEKPSNRPFTMRDASVRIDLASIVPSQLDFLLHNRQFLDNVGALLVGGSAIHPHLAALTEEAGIEAYESYGMTETASHIALRRIGDTSAPFTLLPGIRISAEEGCLKIDFDNGVSLLTNDLVDIVGQDKFFILGRRDNVIVSGGLKIIPEEIELLIKSVVSKPFIVTSATDEKWGERLIVCVSRCGLSPDANGAHPDAIRAVSDEERETETAINNLCRETLPSHKRPKEVLFCDFLPATSSGKVKRFKL